jgi:type IV pilus assembly protein PilQ
VPLLGDIPLLGNLFKTTTKRDEKSELLIFITPRIIKEQLSVR